MTFAGAYRFLRQVLGFAALVMLIVVVGMANAQTTPVDPEVNASFIFNLGALVFGIWLVVGAITKLIMLAGFDNFWQLNAAALVLAVLTAVFILLPPHTKYPDTDFNRWADILGWSWLLGWVALDFLELRFPTKNEAQVELEDPIV